MIVVVLPYLTLGFWPSRVRAPSVGCATLVAGSKMRRFLAGFPLVLALASAYPPAGLAEGSLQDAREAYARGDFITSLGVLRELAEAGDAVAQFELALMHASGFGVAQNMRTAARWLRRAAEQGHAEAQFQYGSLVYRGQAVVQDHREAAQWFRKAADAGHAEAQFNLGLMYERGDGVAQDDIQAHKWVNLAVARLPEEQSRLRATALAARNRIARRLTPLHLGLAQRLASDWGRQSAGLRLAP